jgi:hypothetical protein
MRGTTFWLRLAKWAVAVGKQKKEVGDEIESLRGLPHLSLQI